MKQFTLPIALLALSLHFTCAGQDWISLFDGKTLNGWQPSENKNTWRVLDGCLVSGGGGRSHLFYNGDVHNHDFKNFELRAEVKTIPGANSGIYIHTHYQETGFPTNGYECQVINSNTNNQPRGYVERKMTGSIYAIRNVWKAPAPDNEWFRYRIIVQGKTIRTYINDELMAEYTESPDPFRTADKKGRLLSSGTFALQGHDAGSVVGFRNIEVKPLPDDLPTPGTPTDDPEFDAKIIRLSTDNFPLLDLNVHLGNGLTLDAALANSRKYGYTYGFVINRASPDDFHKPLQAYAGQETGPKFLVLFSGPQINWHVNYDYKIATTLDETDVSARFDSPQHFMDKLVEGIEKLYFLRGANIWARATALPDVLKADYDSLWTPERMDRVIKALKDANIAMEINDRLHTPSAAFIQRAKAAGVRFTFGSDNTGPNDLGKLAYCIDMIQQCQLKPSDIWTPETLYR